MVLFTPNPNSTDFFLDFKKAIKLSNAPKILIIPLFFFLTITSINPTKKKKKKKKKPPQKKKKKKKPHYHRPASQKLKILNRRLKTYAHPRLSKPIGDIEAKYVMKNGRKGNWGIRV